MSSPKAIGQMVLWATELSELDIQYCPWTAVKGQVVTDFIAEFTFVEGQGARESPQWSIHMDESSNRQAGGAGVILHIPEGDKVESMVWLDFPMTNNEVEYETLIVGLDLAKAARAANMVVYWNSLVVTNQVNGDYECKNEWMKKYLEQVKDWVNNLQVKFVQISREENKHTDRLAKTASTKHMLNPNQVLSFIQISQVIDSISVQEIGSGNY